METKTHFEYEIRHTACTGGLIVGSSYRRGHKFLTSKSAMTSAIARIDYYRSIGTYRYYNTTLFVHISKVVTKTTQVNQQKFEKQMTDGDQNHVGCGCN